MEQNMYKSKFVIKLSIKNMRDISSFDWSLEI